MLEPKCALSRALFLSVLLCCSLAVRSSVTEGLEGAKLSAIQQGLEVFVLSDASGMLRGYIGSDNGELNIWLLRRAGGSWRLTARMLGLVGDSKSLLPSMCPCSSAVRQGTVWCKNYEVTGQGIPAGIVLPEGSAPGSEDQGEGKTTRG